MNPINSIKSALQSPKTVRVLGIWTACCGILLGWNLMYEIATGTNPIGPIGDHNDFLAFFTAAKLVLSGSIGHLYLAKTFASAQHAISHHPIGAEGYMPFLNPPFVAVLLAPLGSIPELPSRVLWLICNTILVSWLLLKLVQPLSLKHKWVAALLLLGTFPVYENLVEGQLSILILAGCFLALAAAKKNHNFVAGLWLTVLWIKPQLAIMALAGLLIFKAWDAAKGLIVGVVALVLVGLPITGYQIYIAYARFLVQVLIAHTNGAGAAHPSVWQGQLKLTAGVNGLYTGIFGQYRVLLVDTATAITDLILIGTYFLAARTVRPGLSSPSRRLMLIGGIGLMLLLDPHLFQQDVILAFIALPLLAADLKRPLLAVVLLALATNFLVLDYIEPTHIFSFLMLAAVLGISLQTYVDGRNAKVNKALKPTITPPSLGQAQP
ncbi:MAG TPA: glycosyltransferase family 87 protein [Candidatus Saccharimonadales bacterium]|nr:glycosyltransferase family 87 protein [Candidatus Saccharimonadales bacterium]